MRALAIVHQDDTGPGVFGQTLRARGFELDEWRPLAGEPQPSLDRYGAAISLGGAMNVVDADPGLEAEQKTLLELLDGRTPVLGICLGAQLLAAAVGGDVRRVERPEIGWVDVELTPEGAKDPLLGSLPTEFSAFEWHSYEARVPHGAVELARSPGSSQAYRLDDSAWGIQFHAEVTREIVTGWIDGYRSDPDAVAIGLDPEALQAETQARIEGWNELGRLISEGFIEFALARA